MSVTTLDALEPVDRPRTGRIRRQLAAILRSATTKSAAESTGAAEVRATYRGGVLLVAFTALLGFTAIAIGLFGHSRVVEQQRESSERWFAHTQDVLIGIQSTLSELEDVEDEQRGYRLTMRPDSPEPSGESSARVESEIAHLAALTSDNPGEQQRVARLRTLVRTELSAFTRSAALAKSERRDRAVASSAADRDEAMAAARSVIGKMQEEELRLLAIRRTDLQAVSRESSAVALRNGVFGLLLLLGAAALMLALVRAAARSRHVTQRLESTLESAAHVERYRRLIDENPVALAMYDTEMRFVAVSRVWLHMYSLEAEAVLGRCCYDVFPEIPDSWREVHRRALAGEVVGSEADRFERKDGTVQWGRWEVRPWHNIDDSIGGLIAFSEDISARMQAEEQRRIAALVYEASSEAMAVVDARGLIVDVNPAFTSLTGFSAEEAIGMDLLKPSCPVATSWDELWTTLEVTGAWKGELWNRRKDGMIYAVSMSINSIRDKDGSVERRVALFTDITEQKRSRETIWRQANYDDLTELPNRRMFRDRLEQALKKSRRTRLPLALMLIDLDRFKEINDTLGHEKGDSLLVEAAMRLKRCVRDSDTVARLGGDEFTVLITDVTDVRAVDRIAHEVLAQLAAPFRLNGDPVYTSGSIGITWCPADGEDAERLAQNADLAMYESKYAGGNRISYFKPAKPSSGLNRLQIGRDLRQALSEDQFKLLYQPIVDLGSGEVRKVEALVRWAHPTAGVLTPASFIPVAEESGQIVDIGDWVFRAACRQASEWRRRLGRTIQVSVNKSPLQFRDGLGQATKWLDYLAELGLANDSVALEITEGVLLNPSGAVRDILLKYRAAGIEISLDDFGTGRSSLSYLKNYHIDYLKIDRRFVAEMGTDSSDRAVCEAMIVMAHKLHMKVVAEGIETRAQRDLLRAAGCDYGQGFYFAKPQSATELFN
jgi:diguanylate cyclase (GGDEF)-like protein/PAS domain S-box-containing protein